VINMIFKQLKRLYPNNFGKFPFLKRLVGYMYLHFFYCDLVGYESLIKVLDKEGVARLDRDISLKAC
jgi:hypothetical protein